MWARRTQRGPGEGLEIERPQVVERLAIRAGATEDPGHAVAAGLGIELPWRGGRVGPPKPGSGLGGGSPQGPERGHAGRPSRGGQEPATRGPEAVMPAGPDGGPGAGADARPRGR